MTDLGWRWEALEIISEMERTRAANNIAWMNILRLAISHAPDNELKKRLSTIEDNDTRITELWTTLLSKIPD